MAGTALGSLQGVGSESEFDPFAACFERQLCVMQLKRSNGRSWPISDDAILSKAEKLTPCVGYPPSKAKGCVEEARLLKPCLL